MSKADRNRKGQSWRARRKNFDGLMTAKEVHIKALNKKCAGCGAPAEVQIKLFAPLDEISEFQAGVVGELNGGILPIVDTVNGQYVRMSMAACCALCRPAAERAVAKHPSTWFVDFDLPPKDTFSLGVTDR
jgi:hypothetical protein